MTTKYLFFTGGVVSSVGKGVTAAALGLTIALFDNSLKLPHLVLDGAVTDLRAKPHVKVDDHVSRLRFSNTELKGFASWIISSGSYARVEAPVELKQILDEYISGLIENYRS